jgi:hypothetical protein
MGLWTVNRVVLAFLLVLPIFSLTVCGAKLIRGTPDARPPADALWAEPSDPQALDVFEGSAVAASAPDPKASYTFISRKVVGFSPGLHVKDPSGREWSVKQGPEAQTEVVLSRVLWALGYHQPPDYFLRDWVLVTGSATSVQGPSRFRTKSKDEKEEGTWSWLENPFVGTEPFRGLVVTLLLFNQWDFKTSNNSIYRMHDSPDGLKDWYAVRDLGASLGKTPSLLVMHGTRNDPAAFEREGFINGVDGDRVRFAMTIHGPERGLLRDLSVPAVRWACDRLSRLTDRQWADAFRAGGYSEPEAQRFIRKLKAKIAEGVHAVDGRRATP